MRDKIYTEANKTQLSLRDYCLRRANEFNESEHFEISIADEQVYDFNGTLKFWIHKKAKPNTGMLFLCEKSWLVTIGRRGQVKSSETHSKKRKNEINKHCIFI